MTDAQSTWPYPTVPADGEASIDDDGENQTCECGNDVWASDWCHATSDGKLRWMTNGSSDPEEFAVCPVCGRVYPNVGLFQAQGGSTPAVARYDTRSEAFKTAVIEYASAAYG